MYKRKNVKYKRYSKKASLNDIYSPSAYKNNPPTYTQQMGRIIQTTPLKMYPIPTSMPNSRTFDRMYDTLVKINYPKVVTNIPGVLYWTSSRILLNTLEDHTIFNAASLTTLYQTKLATLPEPPSGKHWYFDIIGIIWEQPTTNQQSDTSRFWMKLTTSLFNEPKYIVDKSFDFTRQNPQTVQILMYPYEPNICEISSVQYSTVSAAEVVSRIQSNDADIGDDAFYPIVSTNPRSFASTANIEWHISAEFNLPDYVPSIRFLTLFYIN